MSHASDTRHAASSSSAIHNGSIECNNPVPVRVAAEADAVLAAVTLSFHDASFSGVESAAAAREDLNANVRWEQLRGALLQVGEYTKSLRVCCQAVVPS
jgi:hypothetical protein